MLKNVLLTGLIIFVMGTSNAQTTFYDFTVKDINGNDYFLILYGIGRDTSGVRITGQGSGREFLLGKDPGCTGCLFQSITDDLYDGIFLINITRKGYYRSHAKH